MSTDDAMNTNETNSNGTTAHDNESADDDTMMVKLTRVTTDEQHAMILKRLIAHLNAWNITPSKRLCSLALDAEDTSQYRPALDPPIARWHARLESSPLLRYRVSDLKRLKQRLGLPGTCPDRLSLITCLHRVPLDRIPQAIRLDPDQSGAIETSRTAVRQIIYGPPGAGKTTCVASLGLDTLDRNPQARVLYLQYNVNAEIVMAGRLRFLGCARKCLFTGASRDKCRDPCAAGLFVMTFDKYCAQRKAEVVDQDDGSSTYDARFRAALDVGVQPWEQWTRVIVDEMQDVKHHHMRLVKQVETRAESIVFAGDPRQEIYDGTGYMTRYWREAKQRGFETSVLGYNHRSSPEIVRFMNHFSRIHFPDLHVDQKPTREQSGIITAVQTKDLLRQARAAAKELIQTDHESGGACCIAPVSIRRYCRTPELVVAIRQQVADVSQGTVYGKVLWGENGKLIQDPGVVCIGTSYSFKGAEQSTVVLLQADVPYDELNLTRERAARLLFVAISRARDRLIVSLDRPLRQHGMLACLTQHTAVNIQKQPRIKQARMPTSIDTTRDMAEPLTFVVEHMPESPVCCVPIDLPEAPEFIQTIVQGRVARAMGLPAPKRYDVFVTTTPEEANVAIRQDGTGIVRCVRRMRRIVRRIIATTREPEQRYAKLRRTLVARSEWTLGDDIDPTVLDPACEEFAEQYGCAVSRDKILMEPIVAHRSGMTLGLITGSTDVETDDQVIEIQHAPPGASCMQSMRRAVIHAVYRNKKATLLRTRTGQVDSLELPTRTWVELMARACLGLKQARFRRNRIQNRLPVDMVEQPIAIALDIETKIGESKTIFEIGAVAFRWDTRQPIDVFHRLAPGVATINRIDASVSSFDPRYYGFDGPACRSQMIRRSQVSMRQATKQWLERFPKATLLQYGGNDFKCLGINRPYTCVHRQFRQWLEASGIERKSATGLFEAVQQLTGCANAFVPHRAFEDAVATAMIAICLQA